MKKYNISHRVWMLMELKGKYANPMLNDIINEALVVIRQREPKNPEALISIVNYALHNNLIRFLKSSEVTKERNNQMGDAVLFINAWCQQISDRNFEAYYGVGS